MATDKLRLLDYRTVALLSETYLIQRESVMGTSKLIQDRLFERTSFEQADARPTVQLLAVLVQQLAAQEQVLIDSCRVALTKLPKASRK